MSQKKLQILIQIVHLHIMDFQLGKIRESLSCSASRIQNSWIIQRNAQNCWLWRMVEGVLVELLQIGKNKTKNNPNIPIGKRAKDIDDSRKKERINSWKNVNCIRTQWMEIKIFDTIFHLPYWHVLNRIIMYNIVNSHILFDHFNSCYKANKQLLFT